MKNYIRKDIEGFKKYISSESIAQLSEKVEFKYKNIIKADTGENPINEKNMPKKLVMDIDFFRYPEASSQNIREKISKYTGYPLANIMCTNGSDEALDLLVRLFSEPKGEAIICPPTFPLYEFFINLSRLKVVPIIRNDDFSLNMDAILLLINQNTKMIFIDSPGNPCGVTVARKDVELLLSKEIVVVVDEAYFEYCNETMIDLVATHSNLVITRTFSKWAGLAGLRIGYIIASENIIDGLLHIKLPYNVNSIGQYFASYILDHKAPFLNRLKDIIYLRDLAVKKLSKFPEIKVYSSKTAYIVIKFKNAQDSLSVQKILNKDGIFIKLISQPLLENSIRVNFGTRKEVNCFFASLKKWTKSNK